MKETTYGVVGLVLGAATALIVVNGLGFFKTRDAYYLHAIDENTAWRIDRATGEVVVCRALIDKESDIRYCYPVRRLGTPLR